jgi:hypothetical protein
MPEYKIDLVGQTFGRWTVKSFSHRDGKVFYWACVCSCDAKTERSVNGASLRTGASQSCGCLHREVVTQSGTRHGLHKHPAYRSWRSMSGRCSNPNDPNYHLYGGRGIRVCRRWEDFAAFWADMGDTWQPGTTLDRHPDVNGNYEPLNVRWATPKQQARNRRSNVRIKTRWGPKTIVEGAELSGLTFNTIASRIRYGWHEDDLLKPLGYSRKRSAPR